MGLKKLLLGFLISGSLCMYSQDIHFSQFQMAPMQINPANCGFFDGYSRAILNYRTQWFSANANYQTTAASFDANLGLKKTRAAFIGLGGYVFQDRAGASGWSNLNANFISNVVLNVGKFCKLATAIGAGVGQSSANFSKLTWGTQYNGTTFNTNIPSQESFNGNANYTYFDLCAGTNFEINKISEDFDHNTHFSLRIGLAAYHLNSPKILFSGTSTEIVNPRFVNNIQARIDIKESSVSLLPSLIVMYQNNFLEVNSGMFLRYRFSNETKTTGLKSEAALHIGCYFRYADAIIPQIMLEYKSMMFGFSYDETISTYKLANRGLGALEVSLAWTSLRSGIFKQRREFGAQKGITTPAHYGN